MLGLSNFLTGLSAPVGLEPPSDGTNRLFVVEQGGAIRIIQNGSIRATPFLDLTSKAESGGEKGLLGLAFHPKFHDNGKFYIYYTQQNPKRNVLSEVTMTSAYPRRGDLKTERILLESPKP